MRPEPYNCSQMKKRCYEITKNQMRFQNIILIDDFFDNLFPDFPNYSTTLSV